MLIRTDVFKKLNGFNAFFEKWGSEDLEISVRAWLRGYRSYVSSELIVSHYFKDKTHFNYEMDIHSLIQNKLIFAYSCFGETRRQIILEELRHKYGTADFDKAYVRLSSNNDFFSEMMKEKSLFVHDDDWYYQKFSTFY